MRVDSKMQKGLMIGALVLGVCVAALVAEGDDRWPTPELATFEAVEVSGGLAYAMRGQLGESGEHVGLVVLCQKGETVEAGAYFGSFPGRHITLQFAVRDAGGHVERFGPVLRAGPESGFHSPRLVDWPEVERFVRIALQPGSLVSNGHRSFRNRASEADNRRVLDEFLGCADRRHGAQ